MRDIIKCFILFLFLGLWPLTGGAKPSQKRSLHTTDRRSTRLSAVKLTPAMLRGKIVFVQGEDLWFMRPDGKGRTKILSKPFGGSYSTDDIAVSPDLSRIVFTHDPPKDDPYLGNMLFSIRIDGTQRRQLVGLNETDELRAPRFSPDGRKIIYTRWTGKHWGGPMTADADIWIMNADGSGNRQLIGDYHNRDYAHYAARWSRDGKRIFYLQVKGAIPESPDASPAVAEPMSVSLNGTDARSATGQEAQFLLDDISPNGKKRIVYNKHDNVYGELYIQNVDGSEPRRLTDNSDMQESGARFSPDGKQIIFNAVQWKTINGESTTFNAAWIMNVDGSGLRRLIDGGRTFVSYVQWLG